MFIRPFKLVVGICTLFALLGVAPGASAQTCVVGKRFGYDRGHLFFIDIKVKKEDSEVVRILTSGKYRDIGEAALPLFRSGAPNMSGTGYVTVHINAGPELLPPAMPYTTGNLICAGMAPVQPAEPGFSTVTFPIQGDAGLGQASLALPRGPLLALQNQFVPCIEVQGFPTKFNPTITGGKFAGMLNTQCNKGSKEPGVSHALYRLTHGFPAELYVFIQEVAPGAVSVRY